MTAVQRVIGNLQRVAFAHQAIPRGQIPVHDPFTLQVFHSRRDLSGEVQQATVTGNHNETEKNYLRTIEHGRKKRGKRLA